MSVSGYPLTFMAKAKNHTSNLSPSPSRILNRPDSRESVAAIVPLLNVFGYYKVMWVFGYGSLVWKAGFPYTRKVVGHVKGFRRRFWWWSEDHRGVPGSPGRVVNLLPDSAESEVWGVAYHIEDSVWEGGVRDQLDHREKGGYTQHITEFYPEDSSIDPVSVTLYLGDIDHRQYAGPDSLENMARVILTRVGPSGPNKEYLYNLAKAMKELVPNVTDSHLEELDQKVRELEAEDIS